jgi:predicted MPP superfamily phosphohydrolase
VLVAHLSDPHLRPAGQLYQGLVDSNAMFEAAIRHLNSLDPAPDLVLLSGDLVDQGSQAEYQFARKALSAIQQPLVAIPGNHDAREGFRACFYDHAHIPPVGPCISRSGITALWARYCAGDPGANSGAIGVDPVTLREERRRHLAELRSAARVTQVEAAMRRILEAEEAENGRIG